MMASSNAIEGRHGDASPPKASINACLPCRKVKMKCVIATHAMECNRCVRKSLDCTFREHRRGRKPGTRLSHKSGSSISRKGRGDMSTAARSSPRRDRVSDFWADSEGLQPDSLLSHQAMRGKFSLQNILSTDHGGNIDGVATSRSVPPDDPILLGLINQQVAMGLFEYFMEKLNPYISQLDPLLHTFPYAREKSSFLFTTILSAASKYFRSELYPVLHDHAEKLYAECFRRGEKSTEIVQAIMILTYWKEPNDTRAWTSIGLAIRIGMDLGWHKLRKSARDHGGLPDPEWREIRNVERTFLVLFVYDRSLTLQTGKPWMIERNEFIESVESWGEESMANSNDHLLCSFVALRLLTGDAFDLLTPHRKSPLPRLNRLLTILQNRIEGWRKKWLGAVGPGNCHVFLVQFYGAHLQLQLFSLPLQDTNIPDMDGVGDIMPFWVSYQNSMAMLELVTKYFHFLYLAQDSVHVMTAYAAIFLIKILLSAPSTIVREIETPTIQAISDATKAFVSQCAPPGSSCTLQARFLEKALRDYSSPRNHQSRPLVYNETDNQCHGKDGQVSVPDSRVEGRESSILSGLDLCDQTQDVPDLLFGDDGSWADLFASTGFNIQEGVFFS
ncbi:hypothetical protein BO71DRAFT_357044 [Aspergillus ellipticus CBS 707.79]|uniref:Zn(2)-C6 fungal-type domain-containing protein n=1 Tax=Aspergillus ellipticus CBS 707.79 TaxID=1448320 RepID=A0A319D5X3_9EURO|nr:hypothetical protein BO71DRAFT_357044 [Aspergillus ellipticus CBS 707.79]